MSPRRGRLLIATAAMGWSWSVLAMGASNDTATASPIRHVVIIIGENRSFDHVYATYVPRQGQTVSNLLSRGIVKADGSPGPDYSLAIQRSATDTGKYAISPGDPQIYAHLPAPGTESAPTAASDKR